MEILIIPHSALCVFDNPEFPFVAAYPERYVFRVVIFHDNVVHGGKFTDKVWPMWMQD